ncbi:MAG TPA: TfuA-related McrA-glycine thioamidation protein [Methanobacteriaceae archaeon]|nr:TfuA-related McrA-glycine thioamidation protein [Euryarchaeota archaeon]HNR25895.1 TfuA-related McrA-glycine thioamidation protein [Methanobacteriaceae archaeon]
MANHRIIIFTGPSLSPEEAKKILKADYRPPVGRGDVTKAIHDNPVIIGIIDGVFHQKPAVSHREIMDALDVGIKVVGGASMGALRSAELEDMGMIGVGRVFQAYKNGLVESDDDVAVVFEPSSYEQLSEALVSMKYNFDKAVKKGIISHEDLEKLYTTAKAIYYPKRNYNLVFRNSHLEDRKINSLKKFLAREGRDIKKQDAMEVLNYIKKRINSF